MRLLMAPVPVAAAQLISTQTLGLRRAHTLLVADGLAWMPGLAKLGEHVDDPKL
jgi:hypothetical protein